MYIHVFPYINISLMCGTHLSFLATRSLPLTIARKRSGTSSDNTTAGLSGAPTLLLQELLLLLLDELLLLLTAGCMANFRALWSRGVGGFFSLFRFSDSCFLGLLATDDACLLGFFLGGLPSLPNFVSLDCTHCKRFLTTCCRALGSFFKAKGAIKSRNSVPPRWTR